MAFDDTGNPLSEACFGARLIRTNFEGELPWTMARLLTPVW
jgi:hypothetical protein